MSTASLSIFTLLPSTPLHFPPPTFPLGSPHWHANRVPGIRRGQIPAIWECQRGRTSNPLRSLLPMHFGRPDPAIILEVSLGKDQIVDTTKESELSIHPLIHDMHMGRNYVNTTTAATAVATTELTQNHPNSEILHPPVN